MYIVERIKLTEYDGKTYDVDLTVKGHGLPVPYLTNEPRIKVEDRLCKHFTELEKDEGSI